MTTKSRAYIATRGNFWPSDTRPELCSQNENIHRFGFSCNSSTRTTTEIECLACSLRFRESVPSLDSRRPIIRTDYDVTSQSSAVLLPHRQCKLGVSLEFLVSQKSRFKSKGAPTGLSRFVPTSRPCFPHQN
ncbi:hypothetical protein K438DRAFT_1832245 [Mycena galopus ATCC 62051]|nr:hypothetical protein K438DRAFT_1832245 [Mycena galopus ATCC 62051]